jgi:hypothetical protein
MRRELSWRGNCSTDTGVYSPARRGMRRKLSWRGGGNTHIHIRRIRLQLHYPVHYIAIEWIGFNPVHFAKYSKLRYYHFWHTHTCLYYDGPSLLGLV